MAVLCDPNIVTTYGYGDMRDYSPYFKRMLWYYFAEHLLGDYRTNVDFNVPDYDID